MIFKKLFFRIFVIINYIYCIYIICKLMKFFLYDINYNDPISKLNLFYKCKSFIYYII